MSIRQVVSISQDDHPNLSSHLEAALHEEREHRIQALISSKDWTDFEKRRGEIMGIMVAIALCKEQTSKLRS